MLAIQRAWKQQQISQGGFRCQFYFWRRTIGAAFGVSSIFGEELLGGFRCQFYFLRRTIGGSSEFNAK